MSQRGETAKNKADRAASPSDDLSAFIEEIETSIKSLRDKLIADFGSIEKVLSVPGNRESIEKALGYWERRSQDFTASAALVVARHLSNIECWKSLATTDRNQYRRQLKLSLQVYKSALDITCGIEANRPEDRERNALVLEIKQSKPTLSFGQIALEYTKRTGEKMRPNAVERLYKRQADPFRRLPTSSLRALKRLRPQVKFRIEASEPSATQ